MNKKKTVINLPTEPQNLPTYFPKLISQKKKIKRLSITFTVAPLPSATPTVSIFEAHDLISKLDLRRSIEMENTDNENGLYRIKKKIYIYKQFSSPISLTILQSDAI